MLKFAKLIAERWNIPEALASVLCTSFEEGDTPYYVYDYNPAVAAEMDLNQVHEVFDFLGAMAALEPKKSRVLNGLQKANRLSDSERRRVEMTTNEHELDDIFIALKPNPRSKAQIALKKGVGDLADLIEAQELEKPLEELARPYVGKDETLTTVADVIAGAKDILAERFAYDETVRAMAREFCYEDGFLEVVPKGGKDAAFASYRGKLLNIHEVPKEELLKFFAAEDEKLVRVKVGVQLFRITEVLRNHFIRNPDSSGFDLICETIDDCWQRLLLPIVERDVKERLRQEAESWAVKIIAQDLDKKFSQPRALGIVLAAALEADGKVACAAISPEGRLLGATSDKRAPNDPTAVPERVRKFLARYKPVAIVMPDDGNAEALEAIVRRSMDHESGAEPAIVKTAARVTALAQSEWLTKNFADLDPSMQHAYALGLCYLLPLALVAEAGARYFDLHAMQGLVSAERLTEIVRRYVVHKELQGGIPVRDAPESVLKQLKGISVELLTEIRNHDARQAFTSKFDIRSTKDISEVAFRNIAGYIVLPHSANALDTTLVHPYYYEWLEEIADDIGTSTEGLVANPDLLRSYSRGEFSRSLYVQRNLMEQLRVGSRTASQAPQQPRRRLKLAELQENMVVAGRVTNITPFGVFVNINAVCDGLVHISQLADTYVETPDQVVSVGDKVNVRIINIDVKKRRISLSMKGLGHSGPRVRPSKGQLDTLVEHFGKR